MLNCAGPGIPPTVELFRVDRPGRWAASGGDPGRASTGCPDCSLNWPPNAEFLRRMDAAVADLRRYTASRAWYQTAAAGPPSCRGHPILLTGVGITAVLPQYSGGSASWPATTSSRPATSAPDHRRWPAVPARLLHPVPVRPTAGRPSAYPADDPNGLPLTLLRHPGSDPRTPRGRWPWDKARMGQRERRGAGQGHVTPGEGKQPHRAGLQAQVGGCLRFARSLRGKENEPALHESPPALRRRHRHRLRQELLMGIGGGPPCAPSAPSTGPRRPECSHQRGPRRLPRPGADQGVPDLRPVLRRGARAVPGRHRLHHPHPGAGRHRPLPPRADRALLRPRGQPPARPVARARRRDPTPAATRTCSTWP